MPAPASGPTTSNNADGDTDALTEGDTVTETFTATVTDDKGATDTQVVTITVEGTNDAPVATDVSVAGVEDLSALGLAVANDVDDGDTLTYSFETDPSRTMATSP